MVKEKVKLIIRISTFNAYAYLKECIDNVFMQSDLPNQVEILVCDNASDDTKNIMEGYVTQYPEAIRYVRHKSNFGMDKNFWSVIDNAKGEFVHLLGNDDRYTDSRLKKILSQIDKEKDLDVFCLSNNYLNTLNGKIIENSESDANDIFCKSSGGTFWLSERLKTLTLSNIVVRKSKCLEIENIENFFGTNWLHMVLLTLIVKLTTTVCIFNFNNPIVTVRIGNQRWLDNDVAVAYYYNALSIYSNLKNIGYENNVFNHIKTFFLQLLYNGSRINYNSKLLNIVYALKFFRFYYDKPILYIKFCAKLILLKHKPFFLGLGG